MSPSLNGVLEENDIIELTRELPIGAFHGAKDERWLVSACLRVNGVPSYQLVRPSKTGKSITTHEQIETIDTLVADKKIRVLRRRA